MAKNHPPTGYEPNVLDDFHYSETSAMIFQDESVDKDTEPSYLCDAELDDETDGKALSSPLFIQERGESADRRQACHSYEESLLPAHSFSTHTHKNGETRARTLFVQTNQVAKWKTKQSGFSLKDKKGKFSLILASRNGMELSNLSEEKLIILLRVVDNFGEINYFCMNNYQNKIGIFVKLI